MIRPIVRFAAVVSFVCIALGQPFGEVRFEMARRMRQLDVAFHSSRPDQRKRAIPYLSEAAKCVLAGNNRKVCEQLDLARLALISEIEPPLLVRWAQSVYVTPERQLNDASATTLRLKVATIYDAALGVPDDISLHLQALSSKGVSLADKTLRLEELPFSYDLSVTLLGGDHSLSLEVIHRGRTLALCTRRVSAASRLNERLAALKKSVESAASKSRTVDAATAFALYRLVRAAASNRPLDEDLSAAQLLNEAERVAAAVVSRKPYFGPIRTGDLRLTIPVQSGMAALRVFVPPEARRKRPLPLLVTVHGVGVNEGVWFDGYGDGELVAICRARGWMLVAPRMTMGSPPLAEIVDRFAKVYPVDRKRVFLVGHTFGVGAVTSAVIAAPNSFAGVGLLSAGAPTSAEVALRAIRVFVGVGSEDRAKASATRLYDALIKGGSKRAMLKEYPGTESSTVVTAALNDMVKFLEGKSE